MEKEFEASILQSLIKQGGKKKLDALLTLFRAESPRRLQELEAAQDPKEAKAIAAVLKNSCGNLGLLGLEELCEQVLAGVPHQAVLPAMKTAHARALEHLARQRAAI